MITTDKTPDDIVVFEGTLKGSILQEPDSVRIPGFPFESLFMVNSWGKEGILLGKINNLSVDQRKQQNMLTHREIALQKAIDHIVQLIKS